jgi:hypothetical protein
MDDNVRLPKSFDYRAPNVYPRAKRVTLKISAINNTATPGQTSRFMIPCAANSFLDLANAQLQYTMTTPVATAGNYFALDHSAYSLYQSAALYDNNGQQIDQTLEAGLLMTTLRDIYCSYNSRNSSLGIMEGCLRVASGSAQGVLSRQGAAGAIAAALALNVSTLVPLGSFFSAHKMMPSFQYAGSPGLRLDLEFAPGWKAIISPLADVAVAASYTISNLYLVVDQITLDDTGMSMVLAGGPQYYQFSSYALFSQVLASSTANQTLPLGIRYRALLNALVTVNSNGKPTGNTNMVRAVGNRAPLTSLQMTIDSINYPQQALSGTTVLGFSDFLAHLEGAVRNQNNTLKESCLNYSEYSQVFADAIGPNGTGNVLTPADLGTYNTGASFCAMVDLQTDSQGISNDLVAGLNCSNSDVRINVAQAQAHGTILNVWANHIRILMIDNGVSRLEF